MRNIRSLLIICGITGMALLTIALHQAWAADFDGSAPVLCAFTSSIDCDSDNGCGGTTTESLDLPSFFKIDFKGNTISGVGPTDESRVHKTTPITVLQRMNGTLILQGVQLRAWSMVINEKTGRMTLTASDDDEAFVLFGVCTEL